jgi:hypothetical protein
VAEHSHTIGATAEKIYREFLRFGLPYLRGVRYFRWWQTARRRALYVEAEFLQNLYVTILEPEFVNHDIWFLNYQARWFLTHADPRHAAFYYHHEALIRELFTLVPERLREKLEWTGLDHTHDV